ncbi:nitroreductase [Maribellus comscasis]|uniref:Putative NAD(P)H nitroreductase n=1 Tax=Maribellus comscasis TaxID=2681766 RepID=A0A6I6JIL2_9BACT|nr:nitroreductase [Maribellus comscasis]QGY42576.1 nitroreductase [Maribellus comscasis]
MNINDTIKNRRATPPRFISKEKISEETIKQLLENANWAPNHKQTEPWRFKVYSGAAKEKLADDIFLQLEEKMKEGANVNAQKAEKLRENIKRVPVVISVAMQRDEAQRIPEWEEVAAVSMAVQNMWLTATEMGLGAFWATPYFISLLHDILEVEPGQLPMGFFYVGKVAMDYPSPGRGPVDSKVEWK